jgi:hypothetical protein
LPYVSNGEGFQGLSNELYCLLVEKCLGESLLPLPSYSPCRPGHSAILLPVVILSPQVVILSEAKDLARPPCHPSPNRLYFKQPTEYVFNCQAKEERVVDIGAPKDYFISYTHADQRWAEWIAWLLEEAGYTTMLQAWDFIAGSNFVIEMDAAASMASPCCSLV